MRVVTLEEHISLPQFDNRISKEARMARGWPTPDSATSPMKRVEEALAEVGDMRIKSMDEAGVTVQVLSVTAPDGDIMEADKAVAYAKEYNDEIKRLTDMHASRFAAFAVLPMKAAEAAAEELERAVTQHGFCGHDDKRNH